MKFLSAIVATLILGLFVVGAQEPPLPAATETPAASPSARPQLNIPEIPMEVEPSPLVPNTSATPKKTAPSISELDTIFQHSSLGQVAEEQKLHLEWRQLKNRTVQDPEVLAAKAAVQTAKTDLEKRKLMQTYYKIFYAHMEALATTPEMKNYLEQQKNGTIASLDQPHVHPSPTPRPSATP